MNGADCKYESEGGEVFETKEGAKIEGEDAVVEEAPEELPPQ